MKDNRGKESVGKAAESQAFGLQEPTIGLLSQLYIGTPRERYERGEKEIKRQWAQTEA